MTSWDEMRMQRRIPAVHHPRWRMPEPLQHQINLAAMVAIAAIPLLLLALLLPRPLVLPTLCLVAIAGAGIAAFVALGRGMNFEFSRRHCVGRRRRDGVYRVRFRHPEQSGAPDLADDVTILRVSE